MKKLALLCGLVAIGASANAIILYDQLNQTPNAGNGSWEGGSTDFGGNNAGLQVGQRVTSVAGGEIITRVVGEFIHFADPTVVDALVQVFNLSGTTVGSLVGEQVVVPNVAYLGAHPIFSGFRKTNIEALVSIGTLVNGNDYLVVLQPRSDRWGYLARLTNMANTNTFNRDYSRFGYPGGYGHTDWREMGTGQFGAGNANMLVEAVPIPEPATLAVIGFGIAALAARRRRK